MQECFDTILQYTQLAERILDQFIEDHNIDKSNISHNCRANLITDLTTATAVSTTFWALCVTIQ